MNRFIKGFSVAHGLLASWILGTDEQGRVLDVLACFVGNDSDRRDMCEAAADVLRRLQIAEVESRTSGAHERADDMSKFTAAIAELDRMGEGDADS